MSPTYKVTIGLEVHAELRTKSKMFCGCANDPHHGEPNAHTCPVCLAHPGTLPVPNEEAIKKVLLFGQAVGATQATYSEFDRKNYFYPDIPKAYQISQYAFPFLTGGTLAGVALTRVHLEEDTARSQHDHDGVSLVDFNRAGVPLMELVTEPVIHDAKTAGNFARELQLLLRTLGISDAQMEKGEMRVEANISVSNTEQLGTKVEVKNLNSFRSVESAIEFEVERQIGLLKKGESFPQETRGWDEVKLRTYTQRSKESAKDYRYMPDPDIPKINTATYPEFSTNRLAEIMPELPENKRLKYTNLGLPIKQIEQIIATKVLDEAFVEICQKLEKVGSESIRLAANYLTSDVVAAVAAHPELQDKPIHIATFLELIALLNDGSINSRVAKDILPEVLVRQQSPRTLATEKGLLQSSDTSALLPHIEAALAENATVVVEYKAGKSSSLQFLIGQVMKKTRGTANPAVLTELLKKQLDA